MISRCSRLVALLPIAFVLTFSTAAFGQLVDDKDAQKCIDFYNNKLRVVSKTRAKEDRGCIKNATKGKEPGAADPDGCLSLDPKGKVVKFTDKAVELTESAAKGKCFDFLPGGLPVGDEIYNGDTATAAADHIAAANELTRKIFGDPISPTIFDPVDKDRGKCQDKVILRATKVLDKKLTEHRTCKKLGMKDGTVLGAATLETVCMTPSIPDAKGKIQKLIDKLEGDIQKFCTDAAVDTDTYIPGNCVGTTGTAFFNCVEASVECTACEVLNQVDGTSRDCDLFDDGLANASCGVPTIGTHKCTFDAGSEIAIRFEALPLTLVPTGAIDFSCGAIDGGTGKAPCTCAIQAFDPVIIPAIGDVCVSPVGGCSPGEIDCDGGNSLDIDLVGDQNIGACTGNPDCASQCVTECGGAGSVLDSGCQGFCNGGANDGNACTLDTECPGGGCGGPDGAPFGNICGCVCSDGGLGGASPPGSLTCNLGLQINVELPSNGTCGDPATIGLPPLCGPLTTTAASGILNNVNGTPGSIIDPASPTTGVPIACVDLDSSVTSGLEMSGYLSFFGSTLGDLLVRNTFVCQ